MGDLVVINAKGVMEFDQQKVQEAFLQKGGLDPLQLAIRKVAEDEKSKLPDDLSVGVNRKKYRTLGATVSRGRAWFEKLIKQIRHNKKLEIDAQISDKKEEISALETELELVTTNGKDVLVFLATLRDEMKAPAAQWEDADKLRKEKIEAELAEISVLQEIEESQPSEIFEQAIEKCEAFVVDDRLQEFQKKAREIQKTTLEYLKLKLQIAKTREEDEARRQKEHDEKIKREATQKAEVDAAEEKGRAKAREEKLKKDNAELVQKNIDGLIERGKIADNASAEEIQQRIVYFAKLSIASDHYGDRVEEAREIQSKVKAALSKFYTTKLRLDKEDEEQRERQKVLDDAKAAEEAVKREDARKAAEEKKRRADREHVRRIDKEILEDVINLGLGLDTASAVKFRKFLKDGAIRHVFIKV